MTVWEISQRYEYICKVLYLSMDQLENMWLFQFLHSVISVLPSLAQLRRGADRWGVVVTVIITACLLTCSLGDFVSLGSLPVLIALSGLAMYLSEVMFPLQFSFPCPKPCKNYRRALMWGISPNRIQFLSPWQNYEWFMQHKSIIPLHALKEACVCLDALHNHSCSVASQFLCWAQNCEAFSTNANQSKFTAHPTETPLKSGKLFYVCKCYHLFRVHKDCSSFSPHTDPSGMAGRALKSPQLPPLGLTE